MCRVPGDAEALKLVLAMSPALMFCQLVAVGVVGIIGCTHDDVVACCKRSLIYIYILW